MKLGNIRKEIQKLVKHCENIMENDGEYITYEPFEDEYQ